MSAQPDLRTYTGQDHRQWEGDWALIDGYPVAMAPSLVFEHQHVSARIFRQLDQALDDCPRCEALFEIDVEFSDDTVVRPDVLVICYSPEGQHLTRAPDLLFEVISPKTARVDEVNKFELYQREGVAFYVVVYPAAKKAKVWQLVAGQYRKVADFQDEHYRFDLSKCSIEFDFGRLWKRKGAA